MLKTGVKVDILSLIGNIASILSLIISIFVASRVISIENKITVDGEENIVAGRDARVER